MHHRGICGLTGSLALLALAGSGARGEVFTLWGGEWGGDGFWSDHLVWNGPANAYSDSVLENATVQGVSNEVDMDVAVGQLRSLFDAEVFSGGHSLIVGGDALVDGTHSTQVAPPTPALRNLDCARWDCTMAPWSCAAFNTQEMIADLSNDGQWNFFDVSLYLSVLEPGCLMLRL